MRSHAASSAGLDELITVETECSKHVPHLKALAERVILTKASWGYPTLGVDEIIPLSRGYSAPETIDLGD